MEIAILPGDHITKAAARACALAKKEGREVTFTFNSEKLAATTDTTPEQVVALYDALCKAAHDRWLASPAGKKHTAEQEERAAREAKRKRKPITEEDHEQGEWYATAKKQTLDSLPEFLRHLADDYGHDYGTICHALAAGAVAAATALNHSDTGGITGFQAGAVMWEFIRNWNGEKGPMRLVQYKDMLYPQHNDVFAQTIDSKTWQWLQDEARKCLAASDGAHPAVKAHWESIVAGDVPFGYVVKDE